MRPLAGIGVLDSTRVLSQTPAEIRLPPPLLGQHTDQVLLDAGYTAEEIAEWRSRKVV